MRQRLRTSDFGFRTWGMAVLLFVALPVFATTVKKMDLAELVRTSDRIVQGRVEAVEVQYDTRLRLPFTWVRVRVDDPLKGDRRQTLFMKHVGGRVETPTGPIFVTANGSPQFQLGDNVIVFLRTLDDGSHQVVGLNQGKYEVINETAVLNVSGVELMDPKTGKMLPAGFIEKAPVDALKAKIRELVK